ncbi:MAG: carboxylating nicotinate-nucleotide diphosphorylase [Candidatus Sericytochromatia bacterium]|nr:carboxylating nicotinate-nucleotide diphosphorylase [Candidatus Sericytochromatia bacterium]
MPPNREQLHHWIAQFLAEDIGRGDVTSQLVVPAGCQAHGRFVAREPMVLAGLPFAASVFSQVGSVVVVGWAADGDRISAQDVIAELTGTARDMLTGERVALNLLQHLSGVATLTRRYVDAVAGTNARIVDTRKTLPGLRALQKYAVAIGGASNHRFALDDGIMIKDNHIAAAGGLAKAVKAAQAGRPHLLRIELEVDSLAQLEEALTLDVDVVLLDNMSPAQVSEAVAMANASKSRRPVLEASGGINLTTVRGYAEAGVDLISVGALTHSAVGVDIGLDLQTGTATP